MKLEQLQTAWQTYHQQAAASQPSSFATEMITKSVKFEATLWRRDWIETCAAIFVIVAFGSMLFTDELSPISVLGILVILVATVGVVWVLHCTRKHQSMIPPDHSLLECIRVELNRVEMQIQLLRNVTVWYTTPLTLGAVVFVYGLFDPWWVAFIAAGGFLVIFMLVGLLIHRMNQHCIKQNTCPVAAAID